MRRFALGFLLLIIALVFLSPAAAQESECLAPSFVAVDPHYGNWVDVSCGNGYLRVGQVSRDMGWTSIDSDIPLNNPDSQELVLGVDWQYLIKDDDSPEVVLWVVTNLGVAHYDFSTNLSYRYDFAAEANVIEIVPHLDGSYRSRSVAVLTSQGEVWVYGPDSEGEWSVSSVSPSKASPESGLLWGIRGIVYTDPNGLVHQYNPLTGVDEVFVASPSPTIYTNFAFAPARELIYAGNESAISIWNAYGSYLGEYTAQSLCSTQTIGAFTTIAKGELYELAFECGDGVVHILDSANSLSEHEIPSRYFDWNNGSGVDPLTREVQMTITR